jgi:cytochrome c oxidase subunit IV
MGNHAAEHIREENHLAMTEAEYKHHKTDVWKTTALLSFVTVFEVVFAIMYDKLHLGPGWLLRVVLIVLSLVKAGYIMAVFMHLKHETKSFIFTILIPFTLLIWMIIAFMMDGQSWHDFNQNRFKETPLKEIQKQHGGVVKEHH